MISDIVNVPVSDKAAIRIAWTGHSLVLCGLCLQCTILVIPGPTIIKRFFEFRIQRIKHYQGTQQQPRKQGIACVHCQWQWPHEKIAWDKFQWRAWMFFGQKHHSRADRTISSTGINLASFCRVVMTPNLYQIYIKNHDASVNVSDSSTRTA
jgi:hypothetical protein